MYDAQAALERADTAAALAALDTVRVNAISNPFPRLLKAELLMKRGQTAEALDIVRDGFLCPCTARVMMALMTAELAERAGERELAIENYALVARLWRKADPELQHLVKKARDGLARLGADERTPLRL
jgi:hypothetical protein